MKITEILSKFGKYVSLITGTMTVDGYFRGRVSDLKDETINSLVEQNKYKENIIKDQLENIIVDNNLKNPPLSYEFSYEFSYELRALREEGISENCRRSMGMEKADTIVSKIDALKQQLGSENLDESAKTVLESQLNKKQVEFKYEFTNAVDNFNELIKVVQDWTTGGGKNNNNLLPNIQVQDTINQAQVLIDGLTQSQKLAVIHISASVTILFCLFTLVGVYFGDWFLDYFRLEYRFTRLARYFSLRRKLRTSYFIWNSLLIFIVVLALIIINIVAFTDDFSEYLNTIV
jgi:hypothetical protein